MIKRYAILVLILALIVVVAQSMNAPVSEYVFRSTDQHEQDRSMIIRFSHQYHLQEVQAECSTCHIAAPTSMKSSDNLLGTMEQCAGCHDVKDETKCMTCHVDKEHLVKFENPKREMIFPHASHVDAQKMKCETCHDGLEKVTFATRANMPSMETCNTCHDDRKVSNQCETCHTNFATLLPEEHGQSNFRRNHKNLVRLGALDVSCQTCHTERTCQQCHQGAGLKQFGQKDLISEPRPIRTTKDSPDEMVLQKIHDLNYKFTHGIDAKARLNDCLSCHNTQEFCAACHNEGGNITAGKFKPASHSVPGFTTIGVGSGGGDHAIQAKRDIESCMSCHNVAGRDPTCMTCHTDNGKVR